MTTSHNIKSIQVEGGFLTGSKIVFDGRLNCLIGGRGTGKTTVLELIRYAFGFTPDSRIEPVKAREFNKLISANLGDANSVTLEIETLNGLKYTVRRKGGDEPPVIKDDAGNIKQIDFRRSQLFDAEIYSQNDIENAASNPRDQLNIIDRFREDDLNDIAKELSALKRELEDNAIDILSMMSQSASLQDDISEIDGVSEKLKAFDIEAGENPEEVSQQGAKIQAVAKEQKAIGNLITGLSDSEDELSSWLQDLERLIDKAFISSNLTGPNRNQIEELRQSFNSALPELRQHLQSVLDALSSLRQDSDQAGQNIENQILTLQEEYDQTLARHQEVKGKVQERDKLHKLYDELLAIAVVFVFWISKSLLNTDDDIDSNEIRLAYIPYSADLPFFVAQEMGMFKQRGLDITPLECASSSEALDLVLAGRADGSMGNSFSVLFSIQAKDSEILRLINVSVETLENESYTGFLLVNSNSNIQDIEYLKGKTVGTGKGASQLLWVQLYFQNLGWDPKKDVFIEQEDPNILLDALHSGQIDALFLFEPYATVGISKGLAKSFVPFFRKSIINPFPAGGAVLTKEFCNKQPKLAMKVIEALDQAIEYINANPLASKKTLQAYTPLSEAESIESHIYYWWGSNEISVEPIQKLSNILTENSMLPGKIDISKMIK